VTFAIARPVQWVVSPADAASVRATIRSATSGPKGLTRGGRVLSRSRPSTPSWANRSCQRQTTVLLLAVWHMIATVPKPSAVASAIPARQTCFCGLLRSATIVSRRTRSAAVTSTTIPVRIARLSRREPRGNPIPDSTVAFRPLADRGRASFIFTAIEML
jgi:hypothetical protein